MKELPEGWAEATIDELRSPELNSITDGPFGSKLKSSHYVESGPRVLRLGNVGPGRFLSNDVACISEEHYSSLSKHHVFPGDLVVAALGDPLPRACLVPEALGPALVKADCFRIKPSDKIVSRYLVRWINSEKSREHFSSASHGLGRVRVNLSDLREAPVPVPPFAEQRRIVAKIDSLSAKSERACRQLDYVPRLVERYRQAVLAAAFQGDLTAKWREAQGLPRPAASVLGDLVTDIRYGTAQKCHPAASGVAVLRIPNVSSGSINLSDLKYADLPARDYEKLRLREGDVLVIRSNGSADLVGRAALVSEEGVGMAYAGYLIRLRPDRSLLHPRFLAWMLGAPQVRAVIEVGARSTSGVHNINSVELAALVLPVPSLAEQGVAARMIETAFTWIDCLAAEAASARTLLDRLDQAVLAKAFRGELVPQDPADEPASVLLERIRTERAGAPAAKRRGRPRAPALP